MKAKSQKKKSLQKTTEQIIKRVRFYLRVFVALLLVFPFSTRWFPVVCSWISAAIHHLPQLTESLLEKGGERGSKGSIPLLKLISTAVSPLCLSADVKHH